VVFLEENSIFLFLIRVIGEKFTQFILFRYKIINNKSGSFAVFNYTEPPVSASFSGNGWGLEKAGKCFGITE